MGVTNKVCCLLKEVQIVNTQDSIAKILTKCHVLLRLVTACIEGTSPANTTTTVEKAFAWSVSFTLNRNSWLQIVLLHYSYSTQATGLIALLKAWHRRLSDEMQFYTTERQSCMPQPVHALVSTTNSSLSKDSIPL